MSKKEEDKLSEALLEAVLSDKDLHGLLEGHLKSGKKSS